MKDTMEVGMNRTGLATAPKLARELMQVEAMTTPSARGDESELAKVRAMYASDDNVGSVPPPLTPRGLAKTLLQAMRGEKGAALVDKLGERIAFERTGVRLYEGIIAKHAIYGSWPGGPTRGDLSTIRDEEKLHFELLVKAMRELGGDPTAMTPSADVAAVLSKGLPEIVADPRTDLRQSLEAAIVAELSDNACWENLAALAAGMGHTDLVAVCRRAIADEARHLALVRGWISAGLEAVSGAELRLPPMASARLAAIPPAEAKPARGRSKRTAPRSPRKATSKRGRRG